MPGLSKLLKQTMVWDSGEELKYILFSFLINLAASCVLNHVVYRGQVPRLKARVKHERRYITIFHKNSIHRQYRNYILCIVFHFCSSNPHEFRAWSFSTSLTMWKECWPTIKKIFSNLFHFSVPTCLAIFGRECFVLMVVTSQTTSANIDAILYLKQI